MIYDEGKHTKDDYGKSKEFLLNKIMQICNISINDLKSLKLVKEKFKKSFREIQINNILKNGDDRK